MAVLGQVGRSGEEMRVKGVGGILLMCLIRLLYDEITWLHILGRALFNLDAVCCRIHDLLSFRK